MTKLHFIQICGLAILLFACHSEKVSVETTKKDETTATSLVLTEKQIQTMGITLSKLQKHKIEDFVLANGMIDVPLESRAVITAKMEGFVKKCDLLIGDFVQKGQVLAVLESPRLISLQEEYLSTKNQIVFLEQEFQRQSRLDEAEAGTKKNLQKTSSELQSAKVRLASLEKQLQFVGISTQHLQANNISASFMVLSPISGYIKSISIARGQNVLAETVLMEVVSKEHLHIELQVFEKDITKIQKGQKVYFQSPNLGEQIFEGEVFLIGKNFDPQNKTLNVHVHFEEKDKPFLPGMYVNARIAVGDTEVLAVPEGAIVEEGEEKFVFYSTDRQKFYQLPVQIKQRTSNWIGIEPLKEIPQEVWIVEKGAIYLQAATQEEAE
ncbi:MAG: efflux RND transporter periplasmic adaptor subunit [Raineya sp.]